MDGSERQRCIEWLDARARDRLAELDRRRRERIESARRAQPSSVRSKPGEPSPVEVDTSSPDPTL
jgi:hypothetical protein